MSWSSIVSSLSMIDEYTLVASEAENLQSFTRPLRKSEKMVDPGRETPKRPIRGYINQSFSWCGIRQSIVIPIEYARAMNVA